MFCIRESFPELKLTDKCIATTPCILKVEIDEILTIQNPQLVMLPTVHLKDEVEPLQKPLTLINLSYGTIQTAKHTIIRTLCLYIDC